MAGMMAMIITRTNDAHDNNSKGDTDNQNNSLSSSSSS